MPARPPAAAGAAAASWQALGTGVQVVVTDPGQLPAARRLLEEDLAAVDAACSRFRPDSEIMRLDRALPATGGRARRGWTGPVRVSPLLAEAIAVALRAARVTDGDVDPTVGRAMDAIGYDRDFPLVAADGPAVALRVVPVPGWRRVELDEAGLLVSLPAGIRLDLGATAKALAADRCARRAARAAGCGVMVNLGGDLSIAGEPPEGGWRVEIADDHAAPDPEPGPVVVLRDGGLATSGTAVRRWQRAGGGTVHHIVDPRTGRTPPAVWRTVSIAAADCVDANTAATAALVLGEDAADWLRGTGLPARLVQEDGAVLRLGDWPEPERLLEQHTKGGRG
jgi:thiamine biosynthesis lipoprotein